MHMSDCHGRGLVDVSGFRPRAWPKRWKPQGEGFSLEPFDQWWCRNRVNFPNLDKRVAEQWMHRHWSQTSYANLYLPRFNSTLAMWPTRWILHRVGHVLGTLDPKWDLDQLPRAGGPPASVMNAMGTWDYPIVIVHSRAGFRTSGGEVRNLHYWLIEGHLRFRYLNALANSAAAAVCSRSHAVLILECGRAGTVSKGVTLGVGRRRRR